MTADLRAFLTRHRRFSRLVDDVDVTEIRVDEAGDVVARNVAGKTVEIPGLGRSDARALFDALGNAGLTAVVELGLHRWVRLEPPDVRPGALVFATRVREARRSAAALVAEGYIESKQLDELLNAVTQGRGVMLVGVRAARSHRLMATLLAHACDAGRNVVLLERHSTLDASDMPLTCLRRGSVAAHDEGRVLSGIVGNADVIGLDDVGGDDWELVFRRQGTASVLVSVEVSDHQVALLEATRRYLSVTGADHVKLPSEAGVHLVVACVSEGETGRVRAVYEIPDKPLTTSTKYLSLKPVGGERKPLVPAKDTQELPPVIDLEEPVDGVVDPAPEVAARPTDSKAVAKTSEGPDPAPDPVREAVLSMVANPVLEPPTADEPAVSLDPGPSPSSAPSRAPSASVRRVRSSSRGLSSKTAVETDKADAPTGKAVASTDSAVAGTVKAAETDQAAAKTDQAAVEADGAAIETDKAAASGTGKAAAGTDNAAAGTGKSEGADGQEPQDPSRSGRVRAARSRASARRAKRTEPMAMLSASPGEAESSGASASAELPPAADKPADLRAAAVAASTPATPAQDAPAETESVGAEDPPKTNEASLRMRRRLGKPPASQAWARSESVARSSSDLPDARTEEVTPVDRTRPPPDEGTLRPMPRSKGVSRSATGGMDAQDGRRTPADGIRARRLMTTGVVDRLPRPRKEDPPEERRTGAVRRLSRFGGAIDRQASFKPPERPGGASELRDAGVEVHMGGAAGGAGGGPASTNGPGDEDIVTIQRPAAELLTPRIQEAMDSDDTAELCIDDLMPKVVDEDDATRERKLPPHGE